MVSLKATGLCKPDDQQADQESLRWCKSYFTPLVSHLGILYYIYAVGLRHDCVTGSGDRVWDEGIRG